MSDVANYVYSLDKVDEGIENLLQCGPKFCILPTLLVRRVSKIRFWMANV